MVNSFSIIILLLIRSSNPPAVIDHYFCTCILSSVHTFQNIAKQNKCRVKIVLATGGTVGLVKGIIDDTGLVSIIIGDESQQRGVGKEVQRCFIRVKDLVTRIHAGWNAGLEVG